MPHLGGIAAVPSEGMSAVRSCADECGCASKLAHRHWQMVAARLVGTELASDERLKPLAVLTYINMVLRIRPTASPSISNGSPGSTTMVW